MISSACQTTIQALTWAKSVLAPHDDAALDAEILLAHLMNKNRTVIKAFPEMGVSDEVWSLFQAWVMRRRAREPVARLIGKREFWSLDFALNADTLDPRPDTETLVDFLVKTYPDGVPRFIDAGTGSGCIAIALLSEWPDTFAIATDMSLQALRMTWYNAGVHGVRNRLACIQSDWLTGCSDQSVDIVVSNPPYIDPALSLPPDVARYDPPMALYAANKGLACYDVLWDQAFRCLIPGGLAIMEIGYNQEMPVRHRAQKARFEKIGVGRDLSHRCRYIYGIRP